MNIVSNNSKYKCIYCFEQFDIEIIKGHSYSNDFFSIENFQIIKDFKTLSDTFEKINIYYAKLNENKEYLKTKEILDHQIKKTTNLINKINSIMIDFIKYKNEIKRNYEIILDNINEMGIYYDDIKDQLLDQRYYLQKTDLKIIDSEIETFECILARHNKFLSILKSINLMKYLIDFNKIVNFIDNIKPPELHLHLTKSLVKKRIFDTNTHEIIYEPKFYKLIGNDNCILLEPTITHLVIELYNNKNLSFLKTINSLTHLTIGHFYNFNIKDYVPNSVTHLTLGHHYNHSIKDCIPNSVTHLTLGHHFNHSIKDCIPSSVTHLTIDSYYINSTDIVIPDSVTHLTFGYDFNQDIKDCIPKSVTHLEFGENFNKKIKDCIPNFVTHLTFGYRFNQEIKDCIPKSVSCIRLLGNKFIDINHIPCNIRIIE
jgi:hypothetical protein